MRKIVYTLYQHHVTMFKINDKFAHASRIRDHKTRRSRILLGYQFTDHDYSWLKSHVTQNPFTTLSKVHQASKVGWVTLGRASHLLSKYQPHSVFLCRISYSLPSFLGDSYYLLATNMLIWGVKQRERNRWSLVEQASVGGGR